jgi:beta-mannosidase
MADQIKEMFGKLPDNLEDYALASQICQAEAKKFFIELVRSKSKMTGILWWNLIDCWPQFSDAVVDYYYCKKLAYHYIKRVQQDVVVMVGDADSWHQNVIVANDSNQEITGRYKVWNSANNEIFSEKDFVVKCNGKIVVDRVKVCTTVKRLLLISWQLKDGKAGVNHTVCGNPQFDLEVFRNNWLPEIAKLDNTFIAENTGK